MPNPYPAIWQFLDSLGTRLDGEVTFTDPANQPGGGGGGSVNSVTAGDSSITIGGTLADPTVAVAALGVTQAKIADGAVTDVQVNAANKDGLAAVASMRTLGTGALQATAGNDPRLSDARTPTGAAGGDLTGTYPNPTLAAFGGGAAGPVGSATVVPIVTVDAKGRVSALSSATISGVAPGGAAGGDLSGTYPNPTTAKLNGVAITNAPVLGQVLTATDATHAQWAAASGGSNPFTAYATSVLADSPWGYWEAQDASGNATDSSGNGRTATAAGSPTYHQTGPGPGALNVFAFGSSGASTLFSTSGNPGLTNNFTIEIWLYLVSFAARAAWTSATGGNHFNLDIGSTNDFGVIVQGIAGLGRSVGKLLLNRWNQIVVTRGSSNPTAGADNTWRYYLNGQQDNQSAGTTSPGGAQTGNFGFGAGVSGDRFAHCSVLNAYVVSAGEVLERYLSMRYGP